MFAKVFLFFFLRKFGCVLLTCLFNHELLNNNLYFEWYSRDKLELKAINDGTASFAALEKKAALYDKLVRGEISDEEDQEKYSVDFFHKGLEQDELRRSHGHETSTTGEEQGFDDDDGSILPNVRTVELGRLSATMDRSEHKRFVM